MATQVPADYVDGDGPTLEDMNSILQILRELRAAVDGLVVPVSWAKTPAGGIAAGNSSATCTQASRNPSTGTMVDGTNTLKVWNLPGSTRTVAGNTYIMIAFVKRQWTVLGEPC